MLLSAQAADFLPLNSQPKSLNSVFRIILAADTSSGGSGDLADPNQDGVPNLMVFFLNRNPNGANVASTLPSAVRNGANLEFTYTRSTAAMGVVSHAVEWSDTLAVGNWSSVGVTEQILTGNGTAQTVRAVVDVGTGRQRLMRGKVTSP